MGDNLEAARQFSGLCQKNLAVLMGQDTPGPYRAVDALKEIENGAKDMRARSIYRAAHSAADEFTGAYSASQRAGALLTLNKLVRQYTDGLDEIAPVEDTAIVGMDAEDVANWKQVRETFLPLQRFAKSEQETAAFSALAALGPFVPGSVNVSQFESFDVLMPAITDESLRQAREVEKSVSVSYATDDIVMDEDLADSVQDVLIEICQGLVQRSVETPALRQKQGLAGAAHIAITAKRKGLTFDVLVSCEGPTPSANLLSGPKVKAIRKQGAMVRLAGQDNLVRVDITGLPVSQTEDPVRVYDMALGMRA